MRPRRVVAAAAVALVVLIYSLNASWLAPEPAGAPRVLAHRGLYQHSRPRISDADDCSARRINPPSHGYIENTLPALRASFAAGATAVEIDAQPTRDGEFAVFHDDELDCRTNGRGATAEHSMAELRRLDAGYGYSPDGGKTFPLRGRGVGMIQSLDEVLSAFRGETFVIDLKSVEAADAEGLIHYLQANGHPTDDRLWVWAEGDARDRLRQLAPAARIISSQRAKACLVRYFVTGWTGHVPDACRGVVIFVPINLRWAFWGWPNRFMQRMSKAGSDVLLTGPVGEREPGLSKLAHLDAVPARFPGIVMTDRIDLLGPKLHRRSARLAMAERP